MSRSETVLESLAASVDQAGLYDKVEQFCKRWKIREIALFGSALRQDFDEESDLDFLVTFEADADWSLLDHVRMQQELESLFGREVDLVSRRALARSRNWLRREEILKDARTLFSAHEATHVT